MGYEYFGVKRRKRVSIVRTIIQAVEKRIRKEGRKEQMSRTMYTTVARNAVTARPRAGEPMCAVCSICLRS